MYVLTNKWILAQEFRIPKIQLTDRMKLNKKEVQSMNASIPLRIMNKIITGGRGREGPEWERGEGQKAGTGSGMGRDSGEVQRTKKMNEKLQLLWAGRWRESECSVF